jgi:hypothetical protein
VVDRKGFLWDSETAVNISGEISYLCMGCIAVLFICDIGISFTFLGDLWVDVGIFSVEILLGEKIPL